MTDAERVRELEAEVERLTEELRCVSLDRDSWRKQSRENKVAQVAAEARCKTLEEALKLAESWLSSIRPMLTEFGMLVRLDNALRETRAALSAPAAQKETTNGNDA